MISEERADRLESKVDRLTEAVQKLVLVEERQLTQGQRIGDVEKDIEAIKTKVELVDKKVDSWINRGVGVWAAAGVLITLVSLYFAGKV